MNKTSVRLPNPMLASRLASEIQCELLGPDKQISFVASIHESEAFSLGFAREGVDPLIQEQFLASGGILISTGEFSKSSDASFIRSDDPEYSFTQAIELLFDYKRRMKFGFIQIQHPDDIHRQEYKDHFTLFNISIGSDSILQSGVVIGPNVRIGSDCLVQSGAVIGGPGFGSFKALDGKNTHFPHIGGVIIENGVEVGAQTTVCSGTLKPTIIEDSVHIDDHVHVAHNCRIGARTVITAGCTLAGSLTVGADCWLGIGVLIRDGLKISDNVFLGMGSVVIRNCEVPGRYFGNPARLIS